MSRYGQGRRPFKTVHKYPVNRFKRALPFRQVDQYPANRMGPANDQLDVFNLRNPGTLVKTSVVASITQFSIGDRTPFTVTVALRNAGSNRVNIASALLVFTRPENADAEYPRVASPSNPTSVGPGDTENLVFTVTPVIAPTADAVITITPTITATDDTTGEAVVPSGTPTDTFACNNLAEAEITTLTDTAAVSVVSDVDTEFTVDVTITNTVSAPGSALTVTDLVLLLENIVGAPIDVTEEYTIGDPTPAFASIAAGASQVYQFVVTANGVEGPLTPGNTRISVDAASTFIDSGTAAQTALSETDNSTPTTFTVVNPAAISLDTLAENDADNIIAALDTFTLILDWSNSASSPREGASCTNIVRTQDIEGAFQFTVSGGIGLKNEEYSVAAPAGGFPINLSSVAQSFLQVTCGGSLSGSGGGETVTITINTDAFVIAAAITGAGVVPVDNTNPIVFNLA